MLTPKARRSITRVLLKGYVNYRDLSLWQVCKKSRTSLFQQSEDGFAGWWREVQHPYYRAEIKIPAKAPPLAKEYVFWHEFCHGLLEPLHLMERLIGYQAAQQQNDPRYWVQERLCDTFADAMIFYRHVKQEPITRFEAFLFEDQQSVGYAEAARTSLKRLEHSLQSERQKGTNQDLTELEALADWQQRFIAVAAFQPRFSVTLYEHHQTPWPRFVDEEKDSGHNLHLSERKSWEYQHPKIEKLLALGKSLSSDIKHPQLTLFDEAAKDDQVALEKRRKKFERAIERFQNPKPR